MNVVPSMTFPVIAMTPHGVIYDSCYEHLCCVMWREYRRGWYDDLEVFDSSGVCALIEDVRIIKKPRLAPLFNGLVSVQIESSRLLDPYDLEDVRSRVLEWINLFPDMLDASGNFKKVAAKVTNAKIQKEIIQIFATN